MESKENQTGNAIMLERVLGIILLIPPILGVFLFLFNLFVHRVGDIAELHNLSPNWTGDWSVDGGGYTSAAPIYLGLMAIAGAILVKNGSKN